jgi:2-methylisocitrate lyase-like PEP mutase family enzyme
MFGERDNESLSFDDVWFILERILKTCPEMNVFVDCGTGWGDDPEELERVFTVLRSRVALVSIQNDISGHKDNSFLDRSMSRVESPAAIARKLEIISEACGNVLVVLRLENYICGQSMGEIRRYLTELRNLSAPFDMVLFHQKSSEIHPMLEFAQLFYELFAPDIKLAAIPTAYIETKNLFERLRDAHYNVVVIPNFAARYEYDTLVRVYQQLLAGNVVTVNQGCSPIQTLIDLIYLRKDPASPLDLLS